MTTMNEFVVNYPPIFWPARWVVVEMDLFLIGYRGSILVCDGKSVYDLWGS